MITSQKQRGCFIIRNNFLIIAFHEGVMRIEQSSLSSPTNEIFFAEISEVPCTEAHLFNSLRHVYNYLTTRPECIIQMTQEMLKFVVAVNANSHLCTLPLQRLPLTEQQLSLRKTCFQIAIKTQEVKMVKQKLQKEIQSIEKQLKRNSELASTEKEKLMQTEALESRLLLEIKERKQAKGELEQSLRRKEEILAEVKTREGAFVALDD